MGLLGQAAAALGLTTGQSPASTTQNGAINADVPVSVCSVNVGLVGDTSSNCNLTGTDGTTTQKGVIDAAVPVTVCDVIAEIDGNSTANCAQEPSTVSQSGQLADLYAPATVCGVIAEVYGTATGMCMPDTGSRSSTICPPTTSARARPSMASSRSTLQRRGRGGGSASNPCEPSHLATMPTGSVPVNVPLTVCSVMAAVDGDASGTCTGAGLSTIAIGTPGSSGSGVTLPITICGIEAALGGTASAACPEPTTTSSTPTTSASSPTTVPVTLSSTAPTPVQAASTPSGGGAWPSPAHR